jgi:uncharacterized protein YbjQ (UPF0145 family)
MIDPESVVTFDRVDGFRVARSLGRARGEATRPPNILLATFRTIGELIGLSPPEIRTEVERARAECLASLISRAERLGANGVLGLQFQTVETRDGATVLSATGEAVVLERVDPAGAGR